jgi:hypothetical protein
MVTILWYKDLYFNVMKYGIVLCLVGLGNSVTLLEIEQFCSDQKVHLFSGTLKLNEIIYIEPIKL